MATPGFLSGRTLRRVTLPENCPFEQVGLALGKGDAALEVLVTTSTNPPRLPNVRTLWKERNNRRAAPLLVVVLNNNKATLCGFSGDDPPAYRDLDPGQTERICREALDQPDRHSAIRFLRDALPAVAGDPRLAGIRNEGLLATHELAHGARQLPAWDDAGRKARPALPQRDEALLRALGFKIERCDQATSILQVGPKGQKVAIAVLLHQSESPELEAERFSGLSPVSYALARADQENLPYVIVVQGSRLRLYPVKLGVGVGRRGRTETYVEIHTGLLPDPDAAYLWLLFSGEALVEGGTLDTLLHESKLFAGALAERLRERLYDEAVPSLAQGLAVARGLKKPTARDLAETYEMAMTVLFRLLFIAYAEDKGLLPYEYNDLYRNRSLKTKAQELVKAHPTGMVANDAPFDDKTTHWEEVKRLFRAVEEGNREWGVPAYDGGLFSGDPAVSRVGALLADLSLPNTVMGPALWSLLVINSSEGWGPVDFRSLSVREFGTIYEGLLESELSVAEVNLMVDDRGFYRPCLAGETPKVKKNRVYLHNRSGARKASGTYFTKEFAVEHLLDHALEKALEDHLKRLGSLDDDDAGEAFFDFRVADIAMGSGHFLVAAIDRIERAVTGYLARRPLPGVRQELDKLRQAAREELHSLADQLEDRLEDDRLLRRLIARRCIYGVDLNPVAVNLARLSIWIHTFVPGLPLSLLDHNLVVGNSLVGIGRLSEIEDKIKEESIDPKNAAQPLMFSLDAAKLLGDAAEPLERLAHIADVTASEVKKARKAIYEAREATRPAEALCDIVTASRLKGEIVPIDPTKWEQTKESLFGSRTQLDALESLKSLPPFHFPIAFPEVFLRERSGFDVILGNPPWEKAHVEEHGFWARHFPGFRGITQAERERAVEDLRLAHPDLVALLQGEVEEADALRCALMKGAYPGMGNGHPDLYKAFCWRFWRLIAPEGGYLGVVLPRSALAGRGSTEFRLSLFEDGDPVDVTMLVNQRKWVFAEVHPQYSIALVVARRVTAPEAVSIRLRGPFPSLHDYEEGKDQPGSAFSRAEVLGWTSNASLPLLPSALSLEVFSLLRLAPRIDLAEQNSWRVRPIQGDCNSTSDKGQFDLKSEDCPAGYWPVFKGESFDIWQPDTQRYYAWANPETIVPVLQDKRVRSGKNKRSPFSEFPERWLADPKTLPCQSNRIAFRRISRATDSRTVRVTLVPPQVILTDVAPFLLWPRGNERDMAYLLGVLSSLALDWYARRFVETHVDFHVFNPFPIPRCANAALHGRVVQTAGRLAAPDDRFAEWAEAVGVASGPLEPDEKQDMIHELDAVVAHLYGLEEKHLIHVFETFHEGWDYADRLKETLKHFAKWKGKAQ